MRFVTIGIIALAFVFAPSLASAQSWTAPGSVPPAGNTATPINTSVTHQVKTGGMTLASVSITGGGSVTGNLTVGSSGLVIGSGNSQGLYQDANNGAYRSNGTTGTRGFYFQSNAGALTAMYIELTGTNAGDVTVNRNVSAAGFLYSSDKTLKKDIETIANPLAKVSQLRGVDFTWKKDGRKDTGLIAQEVEKVIPQAVITNAETGLKSVEYGNLVGVLIEAVKAQQAEIDALEAQVNALKK